MVSALKEAVVSMVEGLPDHVTLDEIMAEIHFKSQVDAGLKELDGGKGILQDEVEKRMAKWLAV